MTQDEIIEMAEKTGVAFASEEYPDIWQTYMHVGKKEIEAFAKLIAEKVNADWSETNERLIKVFNEKADLAYLSGAKEEREACAKVCDVLAVHPEYASSITKLAAQAIRNRGQA